MAALAVACEVGPSMALREWGLAIEGQDAPPVTVRLPANFDDHLPRADTTYHLRTEVSVPPELAARRLRLVLPSVEARVTLLADGVAVDEQSPSPLNRYRRRGPLTWLLPTAATADGEVALDLVVEHRFTHSAWLGVAPRLVPADATDPGSAFAGWINSYGAALGAAVLALMALTWLMVYLGDRKRRPYLWFGLEGLLACNYPLFTLGVTQELFGRWDIAVMSTSLAATITCALEFTCSFFGLARPSRWWWVACASIGVLSVGIHSPYWATIVGAPVVVIYVSVAMAYQIALCVAQMRARPRDPGARYVFLAWVCLVLLGAPDFWFWLGLGDLTGGARLGPIGMGLGGFWLSLVLGQEHTKSMRQRDQLNLELAGRVDELERSGRAVAQLNAELRRQIVDRSGQLYAALALAVSGRGRTPELVAGEVIQHRYRVERPLGSGGMGMVYEVTRLGDGQRFALKVAREVHGEALARLAREAQLAATVHHPHLVAVVDVDVASSGFLYLVMELVEGESLREQTARYGDVAWALPLLAQLAEGLAALHAAGIVHRDLKPANVLLASASGAGPCVKIADFGIALNPDHESLLPSAAEEPAAEARAAVAGAAADGAAAVRAMPTRELDVGAGMARDADSTNPTRDVPRSGQPWSPAGSGGALTRTGMLAGTPAYMAPEAAHGRAGIAPPADIYALGVIAFELLTGERAFRRPPVLAVLEGHAPAPPASLRERWPEAPATLVAAIEACLSVRPADRPTADALARTFSEAASAVAGTGALSRRIR